MGSKLAEKLHNDICQMEIINTHEHLLNREMLEGLGFNLFLAMELHYIKDVLMAAGMEENLLLEKGTEPDALLDGLIPLLERTRHTTYHQAFFRSLRDLHGLDGDDLDKGKLKVVSESIKRAYAEPDWYDRVIRDRCKNKHILRDLEYMPADDEFIKPVMRMDSWLIQRHKTLLQHWIEREKILTFRLGDTEYEEKVKCLDDYLALLDEDFRKAVDFGARAIKVAIAYMRTLRFDNVTIDEANRVFELSDEKTTQQDIKTFQDFIMYRIIEKAGEKGLPVQIHTGLLAGGKNTLGNTNPLHLTNIFLDFPNIKFDVFHGGFPFMGESGSQALMFPNVYLDTCWLPLISYSSFKRALDEWLCYVPANKFLWGGDCACAEGIYGAVWMVRKALSEVLADRVDAGSLDEEGALGFARKMLHDNAAELFAL